MIEYVTLTRDFTQMNELCEKVKRLNFASISKNTFSRTFNGTDMKFLLVFDTAH